METIFSKFTTIVIVSGTEDLLWQWSSKLDSLAVCVSLDLLAIPLIEVFSFAVMYCAMQPY